METTRTERKDKEQGTDRENMGRLGGKGIKGGGEQG
jgi:hypothetical protein